VTPSSDLLLTLERYYDTVPRSVATTEECGPFTIFAPGRVTRWTFYARPRLGLTEEITADDVRRVLDRRAELGLPRNIEWVDEVTPSLRPAVVAAVGDRTQRYPLLVRRADPVPDAQRDVVVMAPDHPDLAAAIGAVGASFGGTDSFAPATLTDQPRLIEAGELIVVAAYDATGAVVGGGSTSPRGTVTELMGIGILPRARNTGLGTASTQALVRAAMQAGVTTLFLSAGSDGAASIYRRVGFEDVGTACILELDDA
jgi:ribosomal protein S18 acetylase RimI-like enzyme